MESASVGPDVTMIGAQFGASFKADPILAALAVGYYSFNNIKGFPSVTGTAPNTSTVIGGEGNTVDDSNLFAHEYRLLNVGAELGYVIADLPIVAFGEWVRNLDPDEDNQGFLGGLKVGALKDSGTWALKAAYRDVKSDAVFSPVAESTFLQGGTGVYGMELVADYQLSQDIAVSLTVENGIKTFENGMKPDARLQGYRLDFMAAF
jgi:hypothetical protein